MKTSCQVIVKSLPDKVKHGGSYTPTDADSMFRLSFALQELILAKSLNKTQITCWKILKAFQKRIFEITSRVMKSYFWKNIVFWICEKTDPSFWKPENTRYDQGFRLCIGMFERRLFPTIFREKMNMIKHCSADSVERATELIETLRQDQVSQLRLFFDCPPKPSPLIVTSTDRRNQQQGEDKEHQISLMQDHLLNFIRQADKFDKRQMLERLVNMLDKHQAPSENEQNEIMNQYFSSMGGSILEEWLSKCCVISTTKKNKWKNWSLIE